MNASVMNSARWVLGLVILLSLAACNGGGDPVGPNGANGANGGGGSGDEIAPIQAISLPISWLEPAQLYIISLSELGLSSEVAVTEVSGGVLNALALDQTLRFATQGDAGVEVPASISLTDGLEDKVIEFQVVAGRPVSVYSHWDYEEDEDTLRDIPPLEVFGLGPGNVLRPTDLIFRISQSVPIQGAMRGEAFIRDSENQIVRLDDLWIYDPVSAAFTVPAAVMADLSSSLMPGDVEISLNFFSPDSLLDVNYQLLTLNPAATVKGRIMDSNGQPVLSLSGSKILVRGSLTNIRRVVTVDEGGSFEIPDVVPETYDLELLDLQNPLSVSTSLAVFPFSTLVEVDLVVDTRALTLLPLGVRDPPDAEYNLSGARIDQDGRPLPRRAQESLAEDSISTASSSCIQFTDTGARFRSVAGGQSVPVRCEIDFPIPEGTPRITLIATITTEEFPEFSTVPGNPYNDTWSYSVKGSGILFVERGAVNTSHRTQATISRSDQFELTSGTESRLMGFVQAVNIGDDDLPTTTTVEVVLDPPEQLTIKSARLLESAATRPSIRDKARRQGNVQGSYISLSQNRWLTEAPLRLEISYEPPSAAITDVELRALGLTGALTFAGFLSSQNHDDRDGRLAFSRFAMPPLPGLSSQIFALDEFLELDVILSGTLNGASVESDPFKVDVQNIGPSRTTFFEPLYLASDFLPNLGRFSGRDWELGGDSWATKSTLVWLSTRPNYRYNDISAMHIAQCPLGAVVVDGEQRRGCLPSGTNWGSILIHSGHSDGRQIDIRYMDDNGEFPDLRGPDIRTILGRLDDRSRRWVERNRELFTRELSEGARVVYVSRDYEEPLVNGTWEGRQIPGLGTWVKPENLVFDPNHKGHWHISLP